MKLDILELFTEILDGYEKGWTSVIHERSGTIDKDIIELQKKVLMYKEKAIALVEMID